MISNTEKEDIFRALRGGSWSSPPNYQRVSSRIFNAPYDRYADLGFRVVKTREAGNDK